MNNDNKNLIGVTIITLQLRDWSETRIWSSNWIGARVSIRPC